MIRIFLKSRIFKQLVKFCIVGGIAAVINFSIYVSLTEFLNFWYIYSAIPAFIISAIFNFLANKFWTFRNYEVGKAFLHQLIKFSLVVGLAVAINTLIIYYLTDHLFYDYRLSWLAATAIVTFWNFGFNRFWTFKPKVFSEPSNLA